MKVDLKLDKLMTTLNNTVAYSNGFLSGIEKAKPIFFDRLGEGVIAALGAYVDSMARLDRESLHHVYEWYQEGLKNSRLFDLKYTQTRMGLSISGTFRQSNTISKDATKPFYDKARIMEQGMPVTITPSGNGVLRFSSGGDEVFTKRPVRVSNPGGDDVVGSFEQVFNEFMTNYFKQSFIKASGLYDYLSDPKVYKRNFPAGAKAGKGVGVRTGFSWIVNARIGVVND